MATVGDSESALEMSLRDVLRTYLPQTAGYAIEVEIHESNRKKRRDASRESWHPGDGEIRIKFAHAPSDSMSNGDDRPLSVASGRGPEPPYAVEVNELIKALQSAERRPGFDFVSLKWFRDAYLPSQGYSWTPVPEKRDALIRIAAEDGVLLTHRVPNPKTPAFPVTAVRLNRQHPLVLAVLGAEGVDTSGFEPVLIRGEPLSTTVLRDRR